VRPTILASADRVAPLVVVALDGARDAVLLDHLASQCEHGLGSCGRVAELLSRLELVVATTGENDRPHGRSAHRRGRANLGLEAGNVWLILRRVDDAVDDESMLFDVRAPSLAPLRVEDSPRGLQAPGAERMPGQSAARIVMATSRRERSAVTRRLCDGVETGARTGSSGRWD
jgi:hypothetical protein